MLPSALHMNLEVPWALVVKAPDADLLAKADLGVRDAPAAVDRVQTVSVATNQLGEVHFGVNPGPTPPLTAQRSRVSVEYSRPSSNGGGRCPR